MAVWQATVTIEHPGSGGTAVNVWNFRTSAPPADSGDDLDQASDRLQAFYDDISGIYNSGTTIRFDGDWVPLTTDDGGL